MESKFTELPCSKYNTRERNMWQSWDYKAATPQK